MQACTPFLLRAPSHSVSMWGVPPCSNAGTVEFIVDKYGKHYYMETNPR